MAPTITRIERHYLEVPFRSVPGRNMHRLNPDFKHFEVLECELSEGSIGYGETMLGYTWGRTTEDAIDRARGADAVATLHNVPEAPALQMALLDAVGRALEVPAHCLLGEQVREAAPVAWWCIDMPAEDLVSEAERALDRGYTAMKAKGRPWFDIRQQIEALEETVPESFELSMDFNETMQPIERAIPLLEELSESPIVAAFEDPVARTDVDGNRRLREELDLPLANHYGAVEPRTAIQTGMFDVALIAGGYPLGVPGQGAVAAEAGWPVWIQNVGTGITAAMTVHQGAVLETATWPAVTAHHIFEETLLTEPLPIEDGAVPVPEAPGLGVTIDRDAIAACRVDGPDAFEVPQRLIEFSWPDGRRIYVAAEKSDVLAYGQESESAMPYFERGANAREVADDGSEAWESVYRQAASEPLVVEPGETAPLE
jgi:L-alanine-DL-glutamate epimerase-like enolase superfamily enzyme